MEQLLLKAELREEKGKEKSKKIRFSGNVPGIVYGRGMDNVMVRIPEIEVSKALKTHAGANVVINLNIDGYKDKEVTVMISEIQRDVFQKKILHVDFHKISLDEKVEVSVPVKLIGDAIGVKEGGVLDHVMWEVEIEALPMQIPKEVELDISALAIGDSLHIKDIKFPEGVVSKADPEDSVVIIHAPKAEEVAEAAPAVEGEAGAEGAPAAAATTTAPAAEVKTAAQPEVIKKGKKEEEE